MTGDRPAVPLQTQAIYNSRMVKFDPQKHHRRSIRLPGYDYSQAGAFIVMPNHMHGIIVIAERRGTVPVPGEYDVNEIFDDNNASSQPQGGETPPLHRTTLPLRIPTFGQIIAYFKYRSTKEMNLLGNTGTVTKF